jgi:hypothetical protein
MVWRRDVARNAMSASRLVKLASSWLALISNASSGCASRGSSAQEAASRAASVSVVLMRTVPDTACSGALRQAARRFEFGFDAFGMPRELHAELGRAT